MGISPHKVAILESEQDVPDPPSAGQLHLSGLSVVSYVMLRLDRRAIPAAIEKGLLPLVSGDKSYGEKLWPGSGLSYSRFIPGGALPPVVAGAALATPSTLRQSLVWFDPEYVLAVTPLVFSVPRARSTWDAIDLSRPLGIDQTLRILRVLSDEDVAGAMAGQVVESLARGRIVRPDAVISATPVTNSYGLQLWDLEGSLAGDSELRPLQPYKGVVESRLYAWELSALMSHSADHVLWDGLWARRSKDRVLSEVGSGFTYLGDHMVFVNNSCCLEISHLPIDLRERSSFRMQNYGYDSSSIFVWTIATMRSMVLKDMHARYRAQLRELIDETGLSATRVADLAKDQLRHFSLIDQLMSFSNALREQRNQALDQEIKRLRFSSDPVEVLHRDMAKTESLAADLVRVRDQTLQQRTTTLLAVMAVSLAAIGIPEMADNLANWIEQGRWDRLGTALLLIVTVFLVLVDVVRRKGSN